MFWAMAIAGGLGVLLGFHFKVLAVLAASALLLLAHVVLLPFLDWPLWKDVVHSFGSLCALQGGYLTGLLLTCAWSRLVDSLPSAHGLSESPMLAPTGRIYGEHTGAR